MKRITDLQHDLKNVRDKQLGDLSTKERIQIFLKAAAEGQDERIEWLRDTAPRKEYQMPDLEFTEGTKEVYVLSMLANHQLTRLYTAIMMYEAGRDKFVALALLNEALGRLSQGSFTVDEYGNADASASWPHDYGPMYDPDESRLAGKYRKLWEQNNLELAFDTEDRSRPYFAALASGGLLGYRREITENYTPARMAEEETRQTETVAEFYECFHTWRRLAEDHLEVTLDELLQATQTERRPFDEFTGPGWLDEERCRDVLARMELYLDAHKDSMQMVGEAFAEGPPEDRPEFEGIAEFGEELSEYDPDARVAVNVEEIVAELTYI